MDSIKPTSTSTKTKTKTKLTKTFHKLIRFKPPTKTLKNDPPKHEPPHQSQQHEAFISKLFAAISAVKSGYAQLQLAQSPYNAESIKSADEAVIYELNQLSELKQNFLTKKLDTSPIDLTLLLSEIQEQQSLMKMYEITMMKLETEIQSKNSATLRLKKQAQESHLHNSSLEKILNSKPLYSNHSDFVQLLNHAVKCIRNFVNILIDEMQYANWNIDVAAKSIQPHVVLPKHHICYIFESFVCREMFDGFNEPNFSIPNNIQLRSLSFDEVKSSVVTSLMHQTNSIFAEFTRKRYLHLVHEKMELSFFGNLNQREMISMGNYPQTEFFVAFAEMAKGIWLLHCFDEGVNIFQVRENCRFSEVYMQRVNDGMLSNARGSGPRVAFNVVPGFKIGSTVIQSQVYLFPGEC